MNWHPNVSKVEYSFVVLSWRQTAVDCVFVKESLVVWKQLVFVVASLSRSGVA